jgi:phosphoglycolate phosphatase
MKNYHAILFDLDGTLIDTSRGVIDCINLTIEDLKLPKLSTEEAFKFIGPPLQDSFKNICHLDDTMVDVAVKTFRSYYVGDNLFNVQIYEGIFELLEYLNANGIKVAVATYKQEAFAKTLLEHFGIAKYCNYIYGADPKGVLTKADIVQKCIDSFGVGNSEVVLIGDSHFDAIGAKHANVDFIGVTYGFGFKSKADVDEFENVFSADTVYEILEELKKVK